MTFRLGLVPGFFIGGWQILYNGAMLSEEQTSLKRAVFVFIFFFFSVALFARSFVSEAGLMVAFLDVGQGDAIYVSAGNGADGLLDGGPDGGILKELSRVKDSFDRELGFIFISHPDTDHIGGLVDVLRAYNVGAVFVPGTESDTAVMSAFLEAVRQEGAQVFTVRRGQKIFLSRDVYLEILFPDREASGLDTNTGSAVARLVHGRNSFVLPGDAPVAVEEYLVYLGEESLRSNILKAGHHGSKTSSSEVFLRAVAPEYVIVSSGKDNKYGHPHAEVLDRIKTLGAEVLRTDEAGTVRFYSDALRIWRD